MGKMRRYLISTFTQTYLLVFLPFLVIVSLVFVIQISILSSKINLETVELVRLFGYLLPEIFFYTIPLSLIAALANTFTKLSEENELIAFFSLGHSPRRLLWNMLPVLTLFSAILLTLSLLLYPQMRQKLSRFKQYKAAEATLNIMPNKLSQYFGNYHVFVGEKKADDRYGNVVLFNHGEKGKYQLFIAKTGTVSNEGKRFILSLKHGIGETSDEKKIETMNYREFNIYQYPAIDYYMDFESNGEYWSKIKTNRGRRGKLLYLVFVSLSPLLTFGIAVSLTFFNPRYQRNYSAFVIFVIALSVYIPAAILQKSGSYSLFALFVGMLVLLSLILVRRRILRRF